MLRPNVWARGLVLGLLVASGGFRPASAQATGPEWEPGGRGRAYIRGVVGPLALLGVAASTTADQLGDDPAEWGDDMGGLGRRAASNFGREAAQETIRHSLATLMDRSVVYQKCGCEGAGPRIGHAILEAVTDRGRDGERMISIPRFVGSYGGAALERGWRPGRKSIDFLGLGTSTIVFTGLGNVWKELVGWP